MADPRCQSRRARPFPSSPPSTVLLLNSFSHRPGEKSFSECLDVSPGHLYSPVTPCLSSSLFCKQLFSFKQLFFFYPYVLLGQSKWLCSDGSVYKKPTGCWTLFSAFSNFIFFASVRLSIYSLLSPSPLVSLQSVGNSESTKCSGCW